MVEATMSSDYEAFADAMHVEGERAEQALRAPLDRVRASADAGASVAIAEIERETVALLGSVRASEQKLRSALEELFDARLQLESDAIRFRDYFDLAPIGYVVTDEHATIRAVNAMATTMLGRRRDAVLGKPLVAYVALEDRDGFRQALRRVLASNDVERWPVRMAPPNAPICECAVRVRRMPSESGPMLYWLLLEDARAEELF